MVRSNGNKAVGVVITIIGVAGIFTSNANAQAAGGAAATLERLNRNYHIGFDRPEAWGLKYFASTSLLSGLQPPPNREGRRVGSVTLAFELGWLPALDDGQQMVGFNGKAPQDLNHSPIFARPVVRVALPWKLTAVAAAPAPFRLFGVNPHLIAFGLERPILERERWTFGWRGYGQLGSVKGVFVCPQSVLAFAPRTPGNPTGCVGESSDIATLRYAGMELQFAYRIPKMPKLVPHAAAGGNFMDGAFQLHAPVVAGMDNTRMWTRGETFSGTVGASYIVTPRAAFTVDAFYTPLWVNRSPTAARTNDGLFNVRALLSYTFR